MAYKKGMTVGEMLASKIDNDRITATAAAEVLGVTQATVSRWITGKGTPESSRAGELAEFLGVDEARVVQALHEQRTGRSLGERVSSLEEEVSGLRAEVAQLLASLPPPKRGRR